MTPAEHQPSTPDGNVLGWDGRRQEDVLLALVAEVQEYAILMLDAEGNVATWNAGAQRLKGYEAPEIIGRHFSAFYPPEDVAAGKPRRTLELAAAEGRLEDEGWRQRKDGSRFWANVVITAVRGRDGALLGYGKFTRDRTAQRARELALRSSEERFRLMVQEVQDYAILMLDTDGNVATWNAGAQRLKGYEAPEIIGRHFSAFYPPEDVAAGKPQRELEVAAANGRLEDEGWRIRKDGSRFWANVVITALHGEDGQLRGYGKVTGDITDRVVSDRRLRDRERQLADAQSLAGVGSWEWALAEPTFTFSDELCRLAGWPIGTRPSYEEVVGLIHPDDRQNSAPAAELVQDGTVQALDYRIVRADGDVRHITARLFGRFGERGEVTHLFGTVQDVTQRQQAEAELRAAVQEAGIMESAFSDAPGGVGLIGMDGRFLRVNESFCELLGRSLDEIVGFTSAGFTHPDDLAITAKAYEALGRAGTRVRTDKRYLRPDGEVVWASTTASAIRGPDGELTHIVAHSRGITKQRAAEEQLRASEENLRTVAAVARELPSHGNPRQAICAAAAVIAGADIVQLWEPDGSDHLQLTAATGTELSPDLRLPLTGEITATAIAYHRGQPGVFLDLYASGAQVVVGLRDQLGVSSALYEPVIGRDGPLGVLVVMWKAAITQTSEQIRGAVSLLATEAAAAIERADLAARLNTQAHTEQMRQLLEGAPDAMIISNAAGLIHTVNEQTLRLLGYAREELIGESVDHLVPDGLRGQHALDRAAFAAKPTAQPIGVQPELTVRHRNGNEIPVEITLSPVQTDEGLLMMAAVRDVTERRQYEIQLRAMADHDPLTGLLNRRSLERELANHVARVKRNGATGAVLMIDLDNFKYFNDTQGHGAGDQLIVRIGQAFHARLRETDVLVRLGGDEFAVLLPNEERESAAAVAHDLLELVRSEAPAPLHGEKRRITASIGIACFSDGDHLTADEIMVNADLAMYEAKEHGRNRFAHYSTPEHERPRIESQMKWATEITQALAQDRFELLAQPIRPLRSGGPAQYELLLRMRDRQGDHIAPGTFLYIAERLDLIQEIDHWVVARAIGMLAEQRAEGHDLRFEVNLSGHSIGDPELLELIQGRLRETGVPPDRLIFEITETAAVSNIARAGAFAQGLSELGCRFALDDFGAGFGSFYHLKHLPFDYLKIDGEFVRHCATDPTDRTLISAVVQIAHGMGKHTIAEFVGDQASVEVLTELGVDYGQGYFLGGPAPLAEHLAQRVAHPPPPQTEPDAPDSPLLAA